MTCFYLVLSFLGRYLLEEKISQVRPSSIFFVNLNRFQRLFNVSIVDFEQGHAGWEPPPPSLELLYAIKILHKLISLMLEQVIKIY